MNYPTVINFIAAHTFAYWPDFAYLATEYISISEELPLGTKGQTALKATHPPLLQPLCGISPLWEWCYIRGKILVGQEREQKSLSGKETQQ